MEVIPALATLTEDKRLALALRSERNKEFNKKRGILDEKNRIREGIEKRKEEILRGRQELRRLTIETRIINKALTYLTNDAIAKKLEVSPSRIINILNKENKRQSKQKDNA